jgi:hypothetical protein
MPAVSEAINEDAPEPPARAAVPGVVLAAAILLALGGGLAALTALVNGHWQTLGEQFSYGFTVVWGGLNVLLAHQLYRGRRWARTVVLVLCGIGVVLGVVRTIGGGARGVQLVAWPIIYAALLCTRPARSWFAAGRPARDPEPGPEP